MEQITKLDTIYYNGKPDGIRSIRKLTSTITTYVVPRALLFEAKRITGITNPGIYFLVGDSNGNNVNSIYVGQTNRGIIRMDDHKYRKDFWTKAILFLSDRKTFTLDMISGLEEYAIKVTRQCNKYDVLNDVNPKYLIDEYDMCVIKEIFNEIKFIMATLGYSLEDADSQDEIEKKNKGKYYLHRNGLEAYGIYDSETFVVLSGSTINLNSSKNISKNIEMLRENLKKQNDIIFKNGKWILKKDISFTSPSTAACFVIGNSANGWIEWKNDRNMTLDELLRNK